MNTKTKIGIASAIVAALVGLIILDQKTLPKEGPSAAPAPARTDPAATRSAVEAEINASSTEKPKPSIKQEAELPGKQILDKPVADEYAIRTGDTLELIAEEKLGHRSRWPEIVKANPNLKPNAMRVGQKITIPVKAAEKAVETPGVARIEDPPPPSAATTPKVYVVQPGDTLTGISKKIYGSSRHYERIFEANRDRLESPSDLTVGVKLTMPEISVVKTSAPTPSPAPADDATAAVIDPTRPAGAPSGRIHVVQPSESLWKIAEKYCGDKGIMDMMESILKANADKMKDARTLLKVGWQIVIPE
jgi:nucleoid-associated protein YgaU